MSNRALDLYELSRPLESLESFIFRVAQRVVKEGRYPLRLKEVSEGDKSLEFRYEVLTKSEMPLDDIGTLGGFALATALTVRALVTRKTGHILGALQAASVALAVGGRDIPRLVRRVKEPSGPKEAVLGLRGGQLYFKTGGEEVWVDLAPVVSLTVRSFNINWDGPVRALHYGHVEMQDGRILTLMEAEDCSEVRELIHKIARPLPVELGFQKVDLYREGERVSWELGPRLVEPALN